MLTNMSEMPGFNVSSASNSHQLPGVNHLKTSWESRCLRKHRRRAGDDEGCSAKRRRLMGGGGGGCYPVVNSSLSVCQTQNWTPGRDLPLSEPPASVLPQACPEPQPRQETDGSCMEVEAAQRRLQEIEERITLEDDDEDLDVEPAPRRPVLVMSDSLREGLQRGISDILPHKVARSVSHSCMELVVWRPPEDALSQKLKDSLQKQRKQQTACRQPPRPGPSLNPHSHVSSTGPTQANPPPFCNTGTQSSGEEDMEL